MTKIVMMCLLTPLASTAFADDAKAPQLTEVQKLRLDNLKMKVQLHQITIQKLQAEIDQQSASLKEEMTALEADLRGTLKPPADTVLDLVSGTFVPKPKEPAATPPAKP